MNKKHRLEDTLNDILATLNIKVKIRLDLYEDKVNNQPRLEEMTHWPR